MLVTKEGYKLTGDEVEISDEATLRPMWMITILDEDLKNLGREVLYQGAPDSLAKMYWIKRYGGKFCILDRIYSLDELGNLPFTENFLDE